MDNWKRIITIIPTTSPSKQWLCIKRKVLGSAMMASVWSSVLRSSQGDYLSFYLLISFLLPSPLLPSTSSSPLLPSTFSSPSLYLLLFFLLPPPLLPSTSSSPSLYLLLFFLTYPLLYLHFHLFPLLLLLFLFHPLHLLTSSPSRSQSLTHTRTYTH